MKAPWIVAIAVCSVAARILVASALDQGAYNQAVKLESLVQAYDRNEVAADQQYKGHRISTSGQVYRVTTSESGSAVIELKVPPDTKLYLVRCYFDDPYGVTKVMANSRVGLYGVVDGVHSSELVIKHCTMMR